MDLPGGGAHGDQLPGGAGKVRTRGNHAAGGGLVAGGAAEEDGVPVDCHAAVRGGGHGHYPGGGVGVGPAAFLLCSVISTSV